MPRCFIPESHRPEIRGSNLGDKINKAESNHELMHLNSNYSSYTACIGPREDPAFKFLKERIHLEEDLLLLALDGLQETWTISLERNSKGDNSLKVHVMGKEIKIHSIYLRGASIPYDLPIYRAYSTLITCLEAWRGTVIGKPGLQLNNASKPYQQIVTLLPLVLSREEFSFPHSVFSKGDFSQVEKLKNKLNNLIVKSASSVRSQVATYKTFKKWNYEPLSRLPSFFQKCEEGPDLRVHVVNGKCFPIQILHKDRIDYRYATARSRFEPTSIPPHLESFCLEAARVEHNPLVGIDFIKQEQHYVCLEVNPGPGWASFYESNSQKLALWIELRKLLSKKSKEISL